MSSKRAALLVDIGNSRIKWGLGKSGQVTSGPPVASNLAVLTDELDRLWGALPAPLSVVASNVAGPEIGLCVRKWVARRWHLKLIFVQPEAEAYGVVNAYENPEKLGVDRWVCLVALRKSQPLPVCVADCGKAITLDVLDANGRHLGGLIAPGLTLMTEALSRRTQGLPLADGSYQGLLARDTSAAMLSGARHAAVGLIERTLHETGTLLGCVPSLALTGGDAETLAGELSLPYALVPDLVLQGLLIISENTR